MCTTTYVCTVAIRTVSFLGSTITTRQAGNSDRSCIFVSSRHPGYCSLKTSKSGCTLAAMRKAVGDNNGPIRGCDILN